MNDLNFILKQISENPVLLRKYKEQYDIIKAVVNELVMGKSPSEIEHKYSSDSRFYDFDNNELTQLIDIISKAEVKLGQKELNEDEIIAIETITINAKSRGSVNVGEIVKRVKQELCIKGKDKEIEEIVKNALEGSEIEINIPEVIKSQFKSTFSRLLDKEKNEEYLIARIDKNLDIDKPVLFYHKNRVAGIGTISDIVEEQTTFNIVKIKPLILKTKSGIYTSGFKQIQAIVRDTPVISIPPQFAEKFIKSLSSTSQTIILGVLKSGNKLLLLNNKPQPASIAIEKILDDLEGRLRIIGLPGTGKTIFASQILRQIALKTHLPVVAISPITPNLAKFGMKPQLIKEDNWDKSGLLKSFLNEFGKEELSNYKMITLGENDYLPDMGSLNIRTIADILEAVTQSVSVKTTILSKSVGNNPLNILRMAAKGILLREQDGFTQQQISIAKRIANILLNWGGKQAKKINLSKELNVKNSQTKYIGVYIREGAFVCELTYITMAELFYNSNSVLNPKKEGFVVFVDELPALIARKGTFISGQDIARMFSQLVTQSRNKGILLGGILQYENGDMKNIFPGESNEYATYYTIKTDSIRMLKLHGQEHIILPITFQE